MASSVFKEEPRSLGPGALEASPGNHTHDGTTSKEVYSGEWIYPTLNSPWINYADTDYAPCAYRKNGSGLVTLKGLVAGGSASSTVFTLPVGYRPDINLIFGTVLGGAFAEVRVNKSGGVQSQSAVNIASWISLAPIVFQAVQ